MTPRTHTNPPRPPYTYAGFWLAVAMATLMFVNAARAQLNPVGFASYMGLPLTDAAGLVWVQVYGLRALFIGLVVSLLLVRKDAGTLRWLAALALVMSLGDAALVHSSGGTALRHWVTSAVLVAAAAALHRWHRALAR